MPEMRQGTIRDVHFGMRDFETIPGLWFTVDFSEHTGTLVVLQSALLDDFLFRNRIYKIEDLEGKLCNVQIDGVRCIFAGLVK